MRPNIDIHIEKDNPENNKLVINGVEVPKNTSFFVLEFSHGQWRWMYGRDKVQTIDDYIAEHEAEKKAETE